MKAFILLLVAILLLVGSVATTSTKSLVAAQQLFSNNDTTTTTTLTSSSTVTTSSTTVPVSTTSTPIVSPYQNFTTVEFTSLDGCFANNSAEIVGITVYPFDKCTDKSSNNFNISVFPTYVNSSFIRSVSYSKSSDCSVIIDDGGDNEVTTMLQVQTCFSNAFDGPALYVYFGDAPFEPLTTTTTTTPSTSTTILPSSTTSNSNQTTTTSSSSSSVVTGTTTAVPFVSTSTTTTTTPIPQNQPNYVEFAIYNASTACKSDQEAISVFKIGKCYHHTTDKQATSFVWTCDKSSGNAVKTLFNHTGTQTCDENQNQPSQTETVSTNSCMPYSPNRKYSIIYKCVHHGNSPSSNKNDDDEEENQRKQTIYIAAGAGAAVVLLVAFTVLFLIWRNKNPSGSGASEGGGRNQRFEVQMSTSRHQNDDVMYTEVRPEV